MTTWHRFSEIFEPVRPELYRYCRALTRNAWDAEDLVQDTLARALATLGCLFQPIENPRAWLFRVASNLWIDHQRRHREVVLPELPERPAPEDRRGDTREAGATLLSRVAPQERAAILLKEVFEFTIDEIAGMLTTTPGAIKAALHRGREKLAEPRTASAQRVPPAVLDAFCEAFNARDLNRLLALMLNSATAEIAGIATEYGPEKMRQSDTGSLYHSLFSAIDHAVLPEWRQGDRGKTPRIELREYHDEPIVVAWYEHDDGPVVRDVIRIVAVEDRIAKIRYHFFSPDVIADVCGELGLPWRSNGYRYWPLAET
jgi:RNA polymerase sigma-70 factor (ECF subfamily)